MALDISPINIIPVKLEIKEKRTNGSDFIFENPKIAIPSSSGRGEAIIKPPIRIVNHL